MTTTVSFNEEEQKKFSVLKERGLTSRKFSQFVKDAFYNQLEQIQKSTLKDIKQKETLQELQDMLEEAIKNY